MGFFSSPIIFSTSQQIKEALYKLPTLDQHQREILYEILSKELSGGVTSEEFKKTVSHLRQQGKISAVDEKSLRQLIN